MMHADIALILGVFHVFVHIYSLDARCRHRVIHIMARLLSVLCTRAPIPPLCLDWAVLDVRNVLIAREHIFYYNLNYAKYKFWALSMRKLYIHCNLNNCIGIKDEFSA